MDMLLPKMIDREPHEEMLKAFRLFDDDETGTISFTNLKRVAKELGENMTDDEINEILYENEEPSEDGKIRKHDLTPEEFLAIMKKTALF